MEFTVQWSHNHEDATIDIAFAKDKLIISDNGIGYDIGQKTNGFGLELVKSLAKDELGAKIGVDTTNGCCITLTFQPNSL